MPTAAGLPHFLRSTGYKNPRSDSDSPMKAIVGDSQFTWMEKNPECQELFATYMRSRREGFPHWIEIYPVHKLLAGFQKGSHSVLLVDVGGSKGHDLENILQAYPEAKGHLILQDLNSVIPKELPGIIIQAHDFFKKQPVEGKLASSRKV